MYGILLLDTASYFSEHSQPEFLQLLAFAPLECSPNMQHNEHKQNLVSCCEFQIKQKEQQQKNIPLPESSGVHGISLYSIEKKLGLLGLNPLQIFSVYDKILFVSLI